MGCSRSTGSVQEGYTTSGRRRRSRYVPLRFTSRDRRRAFQEPLEKGTGWELAIDSLTDSGCAGSNTNGGEWHVPRKIAAMVAVPQLEAAWELELKGAT